MENNNNKIIEVDAEILFFLGQSMGSIIRQGKFIKIGDLKILIAKLDAILKVAEQQ